MTRAPRPRRWRASVSAPGVRPPRSDPGGSPPTDRIAVTDIPAGRPGPSPCDKHCESVIRQFPACPIRAIMPRAIATHVGWVVGSDSRLFMILREQKSGPTAPTPRLRRNRGNGLLACDVWKVAPKSRQRARVSCSPDRPLRTETIPDSELGGRRKGSRRLSRSRSYPAPVAQVVTTARLLGLGADTSSATRPNGSAR